MKDDQYGKSRLLAELARLRRKVQSLQTSEIEHRQTQHGHQQLHRKLQAAIDSLPFEIFAIGRDGRYTLQNAVSKSRWGEILGKSPDSCGVPENIALWLDNNRRAFGGELVEGEVRLLVRGEHRYFYNIIAPLHSGDRVDVILGVNVDITERKRAEIALQKANDELNLCLEQRAAELAQNSEELQAIYDGTVDGLLIADVQTKQFVRANVSMCRMLGYTEEELLQLSVRDIHPPEVIQIELESFQARFEGRLPEVRTRPLLRKDGSVFYADLRASKIVYRGHTCLLGFFRDATERIEAERALRQERQILSNLLAASDRERQLVSYEIHDGLTQQLTGAIMQFQSHESLRTRNAEEAARSYKRGIELLRNSLGEARRLIAGVRPPLLDDAGVVAAVENLAMELNDREGLEIQCVCNVAFGRLQPALENAIYRIVQESLTNACHHSRSPRIRVELSRQDDCIEVEIRDWGVGFNLAQVREGCFGLEGIRERARLFGGSTEIYSQPTQGTYVRASLPVSVHIPDSSETDR